MNLNQSSHLEQRRPIFVFNSKIAMSCPMSPPQIKRILEDSDRRRNLGNRGDIRARTNLETREDERGDKSEVGGCVGATVPRLT